MWSSSCLGSVITVSPLFKPNGFPRMFGNSLGIVFYAFDTGTGVYSIAQDCSPGHVMDPPTYWTPGSPNYAGGGHVPFFDPDIANNPFGMTTYGTAIKWQGTSADSLSPGGGSIVPVQTSDTLRSVIDLASQGSGAAFTMFATHMQTAPANAFGFVCGRSQDLDNSHDIYAIRINVNTTSMVFGWSAASDGSSPQFLGSNDTFPLGSLNTTVVTCVNTGTGIPNNTTDIKMYVNGALEGHVTGQTMHDCSAGTSNDEDQLQVGALFHVAAGQQSSTFPGSVYQYGIATNVWSQSDALNFSQNPYQYLRF